MLFRSFKYCSDVEHVGINQVFSTLISHLFVFLLQLQIIEKEKVFLCKIMASSYFIYLSFNLITFGLHVKWGQEVMLTILLGS